MRGYACSNCGAKPKDKLEPPNVTKKLCTVCGKQLVVKMSDRKTEVTAYFKPPVKGYKPSGYSSVCKVDSG